MTKAMDRRGFLGTAGLLAGAASVPALASDAKAGERAFVRRDGMRLMIGDDVYRFAGANIWYAAYLGADAPYGDRARLGRELDALAAMGVTNLRILASAEEGPLRNFEDTAEGPE